MMMRKRVCLFLISIVLAVFTLSFDSPKEDIDYSFFVAGHTYGTPGRTEMGLCDVFKEKIPFLNSIETLDFGILTGDVVRHASKESWSAIKKDAKKINVPLTYVRGNHDGSLNFYEDNVNEVTQSFTKGNDLHITLDSSMGKWNIEGEQLEFLKKELSKAKVNNFNNIFIYVHHIIWWTEKEYYIPYMNSRDFMSETLTFWDDLAPLLRDTKIPTYLFAGDVGAFDSKNPKMQSYSYVVRENLHLITSGMGGGKKDNFLIVNSHKDGSVDFELIHLNGDDIHGLGELTDYKPVNKN